MSEQGTGKNYKRPLIAIVSIIVLILFVSLFYQLTRPDTLPISKVVVEGAPTQYQQQVEQSIKPYVTAGLVSLDLHSILNSLQQLPWIAKVRIERVWPNSLLVVLQSQKIVAIWNNKQLLNDYAELFPLAMEFNKQQLPSFSGPLNSQLQVLDYYQQFSQILQPINLKISQISLGADRNWQITLNNGLKVRLGQQQILTRLRRFVKVYNKVFISTKKQAKEVDLQYPNGMAVRWGNS